MLTGDCLCPCREKKLLVGSDDYGRDLTGVQNLRKKHKRIEAEISSHEPTIEVGRPVVCILLGDPEVCILLGGPDAYVGGYL